MEKALVAVDELTGFLVAVALVRPSGDIRDITKIQSVKKKWKDRAFAAAVNREEIEHACQALGVDLWTEHVPLVLNACLLYTSPSPRDRTSSRMPSSA